MSVTDQTLAIVQGSTLTLSGTVLASGVAMDLTGYAIAGKIRRKFSDAASLVDLTCALVSAAAGTFSVSLTAAQTAALTPITGSPLIDSRLVPIGTWDVEISIAGVVTRILQGTVTLSQEDTK